MVQPASQQDGWIWGCLRVDDSVLEGAVAHGWLPISHLIPLPVNSYTDQPPPLPSSPAPQGLPNYQKPERRSTNSQGVYHDDDEAVGGSRFPKLLRGALSGVESSVRLAGASLTGVAAKTDSVLTEAAKQTGFAVYATARKTELLVKNAAMEAKYRLEDVCEQMQAQSQDQTTSTTTTVPKARRFCSRKKTSVAQPVNEQRSASDQCMVDTGNEAARGAVVGAAWGFVTGRGALRGAVVGGTMGGAHGAVSNWKPCG